MLKLRTAMALAQDCYGSSSGLLWLKLRTAMLKLRTAMAQAQDSYAQAQDSYGSSSGQLWLLLLAWVGVVLISVLYAIM